MTALSRAGDEYEEMRERLDAMRAELHKQVRRAAKDGRSLRKIAEESGLSFQRVHQIVNGK